VGEAAKRTGGDAPRPAEPVGLDKPLPISTTGWPAKPLGCRRSGPSRGSPPLGSAPRLEI
jgi:hypothetical protein